MELILNGLCAVLETMDESTASALIPACLPNIAAVLRLVTPTHSATCGLLKAVSHCFSFTGGLLHVQQNQKIQEQLGQAFQAILASDNATSDVQKLAIQLVERLFTALPENQKAILLDELCIVDWLLEVARNGKHVAQLAVQCLQTHIFKSPSFLQHHFDIGEPFVETSCASSLNCLSFAALSTLLCIAQKRQENTWILESIISLVDRRKASLHSFPVCGGLASKALQDWEPDGGTIAGVVNLAVTSICTQEPNPRPRSSHSLRWVDLLERLETGKCNGLHLNVNLDKEWAVGALLLAAKTLQGEDIGTQTSYLR